MALAGITAAGMAPAAIAELSATSLPLLKPGVGVLLDAVLRVTATLAGALILIPAGLA